jgi:hypothetical protein
MLAYMHTAVSRRVIVNLATGRRGLTPDAQYPSAGPSRRHRGGHPHAGDAAAHMRRVRVWGASTTHADAIERLT